MSLLMCTPHKRCIFALHIVCQHNGFRNIVNYSRNNRMLCRSHHFAGKMWWICWWRSRRRISCRANWMNGKVQISSNYLAGISVNLSSSPQTQLEIPSEKVLISHVLYFFFEIDRIREVWAVYGIGKIIEAIERQFSLIQLTGKCFLKIGSEAKSFVRK